MMEIKTRNGFIYNANDLVHSQIRKQIKLAALQIERKALCRPTDTHRQGSPVDLGSGEGSRQVSP